MDTDRTRPDGLQDELEGPDRASYTTALTGAGGEPTREDDGPDAAPVVEPRDADEAVVGTMGSGGAAPGFVAPPPDAEWPDPMGGDDEERELERRTR